MGMPEYVAPAAPLSAAQAPVALLLRSAEPPVSPEILGYQFILGFIPMTRLYFEHGLNASVEEATLAVMQEQGYATFVVESGSFSRAVSAVRPRIILSTGVSDLSLHAYDAFFFRVLSLNGTLTVERLASSGAAVGKYFVPLKEKRFRLQAHALALASVFESSLFAGMRELLSTHRVSRKSRKPVGSLPVSGKPLVFVESPSSQFEMPGQLGQQIADSYGFQGVPAYSQAEVLRMVQRGLVSGLDGSLVALAPRNLEQIVQTQDPHWILSTDLERLVLHHSNKGEGPGLELGLRFQLRERGREVLGATCHTYQPLLGDRDGYWVFTIERATAETIAAFMNFNSGESAPEAVAEVSCSG